MAQAGLKWNRTTGFKTQGPSVNFIRNIEKLSSEALTRLGVSQNTGRCGDIFRLKAGKKF